MTDVKLRVSTAHRILARILARFSLASLSPSFNLRSFFQEGGFFWEGCQVQKDTRPFSIDSSLETRNWTLTGHRIPSLHCSQPPLRTWITRYTYTYYISRRGQTSQNRDTFVYTYIPLRTLDLGGSDRSPRATTGGNTKDFHGLVVRAKCVVHELAEGENSARGQRRDITRTDDRRAETPWKRGAPATLR